MSDKERDIEIMNEQALKMQQLAGLVVVTESAKTIEEGKKTIDVDFVIDSPGDIKFLEKKFNVKIKETGDTTADVTGDKKNLIKFLNYSDYDLDMYPELTESIRMKKIADISVIKEARGQSGAEKKADKQLDKLEKEFEKLSDYMETYVTDDDYAMSMSDQDVVDELNKIENAIEVLRGAF